MSTEQVDLILHAGWVLPMQPQAECLENHSVVIKDGRIHAIVAGLASDRYQARDVLSLPDQLLMPGLINCHGHAAMTLFRGLADELSLQQWLQQAIWPREARWLSHEFVRDGSELAAAEMLRSGTTTFSDMYFFPEATAEVVDRSGLRAQLAFPIFNRGNRWAHDLEQHLHLGLKLRDDYKHQPRINVVFGPHSVYGLDQQGLEKVAMLAAELDAPIQIHLQENANEVSQSVRQFGQTPLQRIDQLGLLGPRSQLVHMTQIDDQDLELLQMRQAHVIHCPQSNLKLASGLCPISRLLEAGVNVALGSDGAASGNSLNLFASLRLAALLARHSSGDCAALSAAEALQLVTVNAAKALGLEQHCGSLEVDKQADIIAIDMSQIEQQPLFDPLSALVHTDVGNLVQHSWVAGEAVMLDRKPCRLNLATVQQNAQRWRQRISASSEE